MTTGQHGLGANTLNRIMLGAGTIHKNLVLTAGSSGGNGTFNFDATCICATSGGNSIEIKGTIYDIPIDGVGVKVKGAAVKTGESATMTINALDVSPEMLADALLTNSVDTQAIEGYSLVQTHDKIEGYVENIAYAGEIVGTGKPVVIIFDYALCTSGVKIDGKSAEAAVLPLTFEAYARYGTGMRMTSLGVRIYYPEATTPSLTPTSES